MPDYSDFLNLNYWKTSRKLDKIREMINRIYSDAINKSKRVDSLEKEIKNLTIRYGDLPSEEGDAYIIVHCHNPEGKEINSIKGLVEYETTDYRAKIYVDSKLVRVGAQNASEHTDTITISPGSHLIKVIFNGTIQEQFINILEDETRTLTFTFNRIDITSQLSSSGSATNTVIQEEIDPEHYFEEAVFFLWTAGPGEGLGIRPHIDMPYYSTDLRETGLSSLPQCYSYIHVWKWMAHLLDEIQLTIAETISFDNNSASMITTGTSVDAGGECIAKTEIFTHYYGQANSFRIYKTLPASTGFSSWISQIEIPYAQDNILNLSMNNKELCVNIFNPINRWSSYNVILQPSDTVEHLSMGVANVGASTIPAENNVIIDGQGVVTITVNRSWEPVKISNVPYDLWGTAV